MPLQAIARLILVRVKVERAKKHLIDLEGEIAAHRGKYLSVVIGPGSKGFAQMPENPVALPVLPWSAVASAGDVVHNLRSALDHLAHQLVLVGSPGKEPTRRIEFPIARDLAIYENTKGAKVEGMRQEAIEAIDALQPYKGGNDGLWRIHELDNIDKHRGLFTVERDCIFTAKWMPDDTGHTYLMRARDPHFAGAFDTEVEKDVQLEIDEAVSNPKIGQTHALLPSLHRLVHVVDSLVPDFLKFLE